MKILLGRKSLSRNFTRIMSQSVDLYSMRTPYKEDNDALLEENLPAKEPLGLFKAWFEEVKSCKKIVESNAVCVATATKDGIPSSRMVLLKHFGGDGFVFFTNYESRKGHEMMENPRGSMLFYWDVFNRQVRIEGHIEKVAEEESEVYFANRPRKSQISAAISEQSKPVASRKNLIDSYNQMDEKHDGQPIPRPKSWGGFRLVPKYFEFWQGQSSRLHDRIIFQHKDCEKPIEKNFIQSENDSWLMFRLQP